jgi:hypothetical protein
MLRDWTDSLKFDGISADAERLFVRLIMKADDYGRFHADARLIKAACFPLLDSLRPPDVDRWLIELSTRQLVLRYEAEGRSLLAIVNYGQRLKNSRAKFPPPPGQSAEWLPTSDHFREVPGSSGKFPPEEKGREHEGEGEGELPRGGQPLPAVVPSGRRFPDHRDLCGRINGLRPEWVKPAAWSAAELHALHGCLRQFEELTAPDWDLLRRFLAKPLEKAAGYYQPANRSRFVETFPDVFQSAQRWAGKNGHRDKTPIPNAEHVGTWK